MYKRYLNNNDYIGIITEEALAQLIRGNEERLAQAEEAAEESIVEYLIDNYQIEEVLEAGKISEYNRQILYPVGVHFYYDGKIYETLRSISGYKAPSSKTYWEEYVEPIIDTESIPDYKQMENYQPGVIVRFANVYYICTEPHGIDFNDIRVPGVSAWNKLETYAWQANIEYNEWEVVEYNGKFYALIDVDNIDLTVNPHDSDNWGLIGMYNPEINTYENSEHEYVVYDGAVYYPDMPVNSDEIVEGYNVRVDDPRNANIKKHMLRLALYELHKLISPNNVSSARITDYETSITWLRDASRLKINPKIPRKIDEDQRPVAEFATATYMRDYDPYKNPWQI